MILCDLQNKLKKLNDKLFVKTDISTPHPLRPDLKISGVYTTIRKRKYIGISYEGYVSTEQGKMIREAEKGEKDILISALCLNHVPEYDVFDYDSGRLLMIGWRSLVLKIIKQGYCTLERARRVFNTSSLGEHVYDKLNYYQKLAFVKQKDGVA